MDEYITNITESREFLFLPLPNPRMTLQQLLSHPAIKITKWPESFVRKYFSPHYFPSESAVFPFRELVNNEKNESAITIKWAVINYCENSVLRFKHRFFQMGVYYGKIVCGISDVSVAMDIFVYDSMKFENYGKGWIHFIKFTDQGMKDLEWNREYIIKNEIDIEVSDY